MRNRIIQFRVSEKEHKLIKNNRNAKGFDETSAFLRYLALNNGIGLAMEKRIEEIYQILKKEKR